MLREIDMKGYLEYPDGGVYWVKIELREEKYGVLFTSPVDGQEHVIEGLTLRDLSGSWWDNDLYYSDILDAISNMGGGRWVLGERTTYDYCQEDNLYYLEVTEIGRQEEEDNE